MYDVVRMAFHPTDTLSLNMFLIMLILVQNNHFSKICTIFCLF